MGHGVGGHAVPPCMDIRIARVSRKGLTAEGKGRRRVPPCSAMHAWCFAPESSTRARSDSNGVLFSANHVMPCHTFHVRVAIPGSLGFHRPGFHQGRGKTLRVRTWSAPEKRSPLVFTQPPTTCPVDPSRWTPSCAQGHQCTRGASPPPSPHPSRPPPPPSSKGQLQVTSRTEGRRNHRCSACLLTYHSPPTPSHLLRSPHPQSFKLHGEIAQHAKYNRLQGAVTTFR